MARLRWAHQARVDLAEIRRYISRGSPDQGKMFAARITQATRNLTLFPEMGRIVPDDEHGEHREIIVGNYRIVYHVSGDMVEIDTIVHGARQLPELPETSG